MCRQGSGIKGRAGEKYRWGDVCGSKGRGRGGNERLQGRHYGECTTRRLATREEHGGKAGIMGSARPATRLCPACTFKAGSRRTSPWGLVQLQLSEVQLVGLLCQQDPRDPAPRHPPPAPPTAAGQVATCARRDVKRNMGLCLVLHGVSGKQWPPDAQMESSGCME